MAANAQAEISDRSMRAVEAAGNDVTRVAVTRRIYVDADGRPRPGWFVEVDADDADGRPVRFSGYDPDDLRPVSLVDPFSGI